MSFYLIVHSLTSKDTTNDRWVQVLRRESRIECDGRLLSLLRRNSRIRPQHHIACFER